MYHLFKYHPSNHIIRYFILLDICQNTHFVGNVLLSSSFLPSFSLRLESFVLDNQIPSTINDQPSNKHKPTKLKSVSQQ